jgi:glutathione S-transferase
VDVVLGGFLGWLYATEAICGVKALDATRTPLLAAWAEGFCTLDAVKGLIPDVDRLVEYNNVTRPGGPALGCRCSCRTWSCSSNNLLSTR